MRIRRLLFFLAYFLSGAATPGYAALGEAPRCALTTQDTMEIAAVNLPIPEFSKPVPNYDAEERDYYEFAPSPSRHQVSPRRARAPLLT